MQSGLNAFSPLRFFSPGELEDIHAGMLEILGEVGCELHHEGALALLKSAGARVDGKRVYLPAGLIEQALKSAPARVTLYDRDGKPAMDLQGRNAYFGTGSDCIYLRDSFTGERRLFTGKDQIDAVRLVEALSNIDFVMSMGLISEAKPEVQYQLQYANMLKYCSKPQVIVAGDKKSLDDMTELAAAVTPGGRAELKAKPRFLLYDEPISPLVHGFEAMDKLIYAAENGIPVNYSPGMMAGATGPVTPAGAITLAAAEVVFGLVIHQLASPGAPFVFGAGMSNLDMGSMQPSYASPEAMLTQAGLCQLGRERYGLPTWGFAGCCASKVADTQAINEAATYIFMAGLTGTNVNHDLGYLEFGLTYSFDLLVMADESVGQLRRIFEGIPVDRETQALEAIKEVGPGGNFLDCDHTLDHYRENWFPGVTDRNTFERWTQLGGVTMEERCRGKIAKILEEPVQARDAEKIDAVMDGIVKR